MSTSPAPFTRDEVRFDTDAAGRPCYFHAVTGEPLVRVTLNRAYVWYGRDVTEIVEVSEYGGGAEPMMQEARYRIEMRSAHTGLARGTGTRFYKIEQPENEG